MNRRTFITTAAAALPALYGGCGEWRRWGPEAYRKPRLSRVAVLEVPRYDASLRDTLLRGLRLFPLQLSGKTVVFKPNLVEFDPHGVINTHPAVIAAALDCFKTMGAREVIVAEGPGHRRDNEYLLTASGLHEALKEYGARYVDLNNDDVRAVNLSTAFTGVERLYLPETLFRADILVSMPKMKTHHWAGVTLALKNMFGVIPGSIYGWPKNFLHWAGIEGSILDINAALNMPQFVIADGVVGMEGDGPIQGTPKNLGVIVIGDDAVAVDATAARLMKIEPRSVNYLVQADSFLGNIQREGIEQVAENPDLYEQDFRVIDAFAYLKKILG